MRWRWLLVFPLAALVTGTQVRAPKLREPIPELDDPICDYPAAKENFLLAYAYAGEAPARSHGLLQQAEEERNLCAADTSVLRSRITELTRGLPE